MKRSAALAVVVLGVLAGVTAAQAGDTTISNVTVPVNFAVFVPCANGGVGENVDFSGSIHAIFRVTVNGNRVSVFEQQNLAGVTGTGETTGTAFQSTGSISEVDSGDFTNGPAVFRFQNASRFISHGSESNWLVHEIGNFVVNADGTVTVNFDNFNIDCT